VQLFCFVILPVVIWAGLEYLQMVDDRKVSFFERGLLSILLVFPVLFLCFIPEMRWLALSFVSSFLMITCYILVRYKEIGDSYSLFSRLVFGNLYIGGLGCHILLLRLLPGGADWLIIVSAITACSDSGAYFIGRALGRRKLCPHVSPKKTVEGAGGGLVCGIIAAVIFGLILQVPLNMYLLVCFAVILTVAGIVGDLTESIIKRGTGTKDSGNILAGHGGILDRVDSLLFAAPVFYYLLLAVL